MANIGKYREQITLIKPGTTISDNIGGEVTLDSTSSIVWARVKMQVGSEQLRLGVLDAGQPYKIEIRYNPTVTTSDKVVFNTVDLNITTIVHSELKTETILYCNVIRKS